MGEAREILGLIRQEIETAVDAILTAATAGLQDLSEPGEGDAAMAERLERHLLQILESCAFQDLTGQRLERIEALLVGAPPTAPPKDPLLNGPAMGGQGLDQTTADRLLTET
ncbi:MAG: hypothetical protein K0M78_01355 [Brevundimonas sp.]|nr:hypothetical protein [Brevundimonas sp.]